MQFISYTSLDAVFVRLNRLGFNNLNEKDIIENTGDALEAIGCVNQYEEAVCFSEVKNFRMEIPNGCKSIIQVARNHCFIDNEHLCVVPQTALEERCLIETPSNSALSYTNPMEGIIMDCRGLPIQTAEIAYYRPYFDLQWEYSPWQTSRLNRTCFKPVRLTENSFFNSLVCQENNHQRIYHSATDEYTIRGDKSLRFSFERGQIALSYNRIMLDEDTGWPLIPEDISYITACVYYNIFKLQEKDFYKNRQGSEKTMQKAEEQWQWYCNQSATKGLMPEGVDKNQNFLDQRGYLLPRQNNYYNFFGKLNMPEDKKYNNPDRMYPGAIFRGNIGFAA